VRKSETIASEQLLLPDQVKCPSPPASPTSLVDQGAAILTAHISTRSDRGAQASCQTALLECTLADFVRRCHDMSSDVDPHYSASQFLEMGANCGLCYNFKLIPTSQREPRQAAARYDRGWRGRNVFRRDSGKLYSGVSESGPRMQRGNFANPGPATAFRCGDPGPRLRGTPLIQLAQGRFWIRQFRFKRVSPFRLLARSYGKPAVLADATEMGTNGRLPGWPT
jgi:hypothetical protein